MFSRKCKRSMQKMHLGSVMHSSDMASAVKIAAMGFIAYHAAKYVIKEIMD